MAPKYEVALRAADAAWYTAMSGAGQRDLQAIQRWAKTVCLLLQAALEGLGL